MYEEMVGALNESKRLQEAYACASQTCKKQVGNTYIVGDEIENRCYITTWNDT